jgi:drug/metabolite transporter (DMT)-like permease
LSSKAQSQLTSGLLPAAFGAVAFSGKAIIVKLAYRHGVDAVTLLMLRLAGWASTAACVFCIAQFALLRPWGLDNVAPQVLYLSALNAFAGTVLPVLLVMMAIERIGPALTSQTGMIGPMATLCMGVLVLDEPFNAWIIAGTLLVLSGVFWVSRTARG